MVCLRQKPAYSTEAPVGARIVDCGKLQKVFLATRHGYAGRASVMSKADIAEFGATCRAVHTVGFGVGIAIGAREIRALCATSRSLKRLEMNHCVILGTESLALSLHIESPSLHAVTYVSRYNHDPKRGDDTLAIRVVNCPLLCAMRLHAFTLCSVALSNCPVLKCVEVSTLFVFVCASMSFGIPFSPTVPNTALCMKHSRG